MSASGNWNSLGGGRAARSASSHHIVSFRQPANLSSRGLRCDLAMLFGIFNYRRILPRSPNKRSSHCPTPWYCSGANEMLVETGESTFLFEQLDPMRSRPLRDALRVPQLSGPRCIPWHFYPEMSDLFHLQLTMIIGQCSMLQLCTSCPLRPP